VCVGIEATGHSRWFERLLAELNFELWIGDPAQIRAKQVRKQRNDRRDARFPAPVGAYAGEPGCHRL